MIRSLGSVISCLVGKATTKQFSSILQDRSTLYFWWQCLYSCLTNTTHCLCFRNATWRLWGDATLETRSAECWGRSERISYGGATVWRGRRARSHSSTYQWPESSSVSLLHKGHVFRRCCNKYTVKTCPHSTSLVQINTSIMARLTLWTSSHLGLSKSLNKACCWYG